jgi:hypothetical protein
MTCHTFPGQVRSAAGFENSRLKALISMATAISPASRCNGDFLCAIEWPSDRLIMSRGIYRAAADLARLDLDEKVPDPVRPGHRAGLPGRCEQVVVSHRFRESEYENAPARLVLLVNSVDLESDAGSPYEPSQRAIRRCTEDHAAGAVLIGHWQNLRALGSHETDPAGGVLRQVSATALTSAHASCR